MAKKSKALIFKAQNTPGRATSLYSGFKAIETSVLDFGHLNFVLICYLNIGA